MATALPASPLRPHLKSHNGTKIAVVVPCFCVARHIMTLLNSFGKECYRIYVVDDACPERSGDVVEAHCTDPRVRVLRHPRNLGVGAAVLTGYRHALKEGMNVLVKIDGDGQMDPRFIPLLVAPILAAEADYAKGNRFYEPRLLRGMPTMRLLGNAALSFMTKLSTGYWNIFDPTNGFTAIHAEVARRISMEKISPRFFFESDILFRLALLRAKVIDVPMPSHYGSERSNLKTFASVPHFFAGHVRNFLKRMVYSYFVRDFNIASLELLLGVLFSTFGCIFGGFVWYHNAKVGVFTNVGPVMLAALPIILGMQFILAFIAYDIASSPRDAVHPALRYSWKDLQERSDGST